MRELKTEIEIAAAPEQVWSILLNFLKYGQWNPFIRSIEGKARAGERLTVRMQPPGGRAITFHPKVLVVKQDRELRWRGNLFLPWLFDGEHYFRIEPLGDDRIHFVHGERFSGVLVPFAKKVLTEAKRGFVAMNEALKGLAEGDEND